jgi:hypothetical protein
MVTAYKWVAKYRTRKHDAIKIKRTRKKSKKMHRNHKKIFTFLSLQQASKTYTSIILYFVAKGGRGTHSRMRMQQ